jgi:hypothetical protein
LMEHYLGSQEAIIGITTMTKLSERYQSRLTTHRLSSMKSRPHDQGWNQSIPRGFSIDCGGLATHSVEQLNGENLEYYQSGVTVEPWNAAKVGVRALEMRREQPSHGNNVAKHEADIPLCGLFSSTDRSAA